MYKYLCLTMPVLKKIYFRKHQNIVSHFKNTKTAHSNVQYVRPENRGVAWEWGGTCPPSKSDLGGLPPPGF